MSSYSLLRLCLYWYCRNILYIYSSTPKKTLKTCLNLFISRVDEYDEAVGSLLTLGGSILKYVSNFLISTSSSSSSSSLSSFGKSCFPLVDLSSNLPTYIHLLASLHFLYYRALVSPAPPLWICPQIFFNILYPSPILLHIHGHWAAVIMLPVCGSVLKSSSTFYIHLLFFFISITIELQ